MKKNNGRKGTTTEKGRNFRDYIQNKRWWFLYIIQLKMIRGKSKFYGKDQVYYTGITTDIGKRMGDYLFSRGDTWIRRKWFDATKVPVYVSYLYGTEFEVMQEEKRVKKMSQADKMRLINSEQNYLKGYKPCKHMILTNKDRSGEQAVIIT